MGRPGKLGVRNGVKWNGQMSLNNFNADAKAKELAKQIRHIASGSIDFMNPNDNYSKYISKRADIDQNGFIDIVAHGSANSIVIGSSKVELNHRNAAKLIKNKMGEQKITGIRLLSCNTGAQSNGFAQKLADKLHVPVIAPTKYSFTYSNGKHFVAGSKDGGKTPDYSDMGEFKTFYPRRYKKWVI